LNKPRLIYLIKKYRQGKCSAIEKAELYELMQNSQVEKEILQLWDQLHEEKNVDVAPDESDRLYERILSQPEVHTVVRGTSSSISKRLWQSRPLQVAAVAAALVLFFGVYLVISQLSSEQKEGFPGISETRTAVLPGSNKARIVFEDGTYQELGDGAVEIEGSDFFTVGEGDEGLSYRESSKAGGKTTGMHTLITPIGGEYMVRLADGTKVWLNANSKLKYPASFQGVGIREVELEGEAYFDVAKLEVSRKRVPFVVKSKGQVVEVLGTEFNINTFRSKVTTTLIEGSVKISFASGSAGSSHLLKPNEQSIYDNQLKKINIVQIDPYYITAWKNGDFAFDKAPLENVMEDIARWYDVDVAYKSDVSDVRFSGKVSRFENIETLLQTIEWTGSVKLKLNGRRITVMK